MGISVDVSRQRQTWEDYSAADVHAAHAESFRHAYHEFFLRVEWIKRGGAELGRRLVRRPATKLKIRLPGRTGNSAWYFNAVLAETRTP
jgi:hypothetical protein